MQGKNPGLRTCTMKRPVNPDDYYPQSAVRSVISGQVLVETPVMPDGHARNPRVIYSIPKDVFSEAGRRVALDTVYAAPIVDGVAVRFTMGAFALRVDGPAIALGCGTGLLLGVVVVGTARFHLGLLSLINWTVLLVTIHLTSL